MKAAVAVFGSMLAVALASADASAQYICPPPPPYLVQFAPDMCGPGFYCTNGCTWYGPSYNVYPPFPPYGGAVPPMGNLQSLYNPYVRSPRDYFMWTEAQKSRSTREARPPFIP